MKRTISLAVVYRQFAKAIHDLENGEIVLVSLCQKSHISKNKSSIAMGCNPAMKPKSFEDLHFSGKMRSKSIRMTQHAKYSKFISHKIINQNNGFDVKTEFSDKH